MQTQNQIQYQCASGIRVRRSAMALDYATATYLTTTINGFNYGSTKLECAMDSAVIRAQSC